MIQHCSTWFIDSDAIYSYDNSSGNLDNEEINTTNRPICADKGFLCPTLYSPMELFPHLANVADFIIISFLVYLSFAKVKDGLLKYFTLNLMAVCSVMTIADILIDGINTVDLITNVDENMKNLSQIRCWARRCLSYGNIWSHALALYVAIISYLAYVNPIFFSKYFANKNQKLHYLVLHMSLFLWNGCIDFLGEQFAITVSYHLTHLVLFIALFVVTMMVKFYKFFDFNTASLLISALNSREQFSSKLLLKYRKASFKIYKYKPLGVDAVYVGKLRRERLFSFFSYSCATEIVVLPRFFESIISVICNYSGCEYQVRQSAFYSIVRQMIFIFHEVNSIIIGLITLIALKPYRSATLSMFMDK